MKEYIEVTEARDFAYGLHADPILRMAVNAVLKQAPRAQVVEANRVNTPAPAVVGMMEWIREQIDRAEDADSRIMLRRIGDRMIALEQASRWTPSGYPPQDGRVVLVTDGHRVDTAVYDAADDAYVPDHAFIDYNDVVGWRDLADMMGVY